MSVAGVVVAVAMPVWLGSSAGPKVCVAPVGVNDGVTGTDVLLGVKVWVMVAVLVGVLVSVSVGLGVAVPLSCTAAWGSRVGVTITTMGVGGMHEVTKQLTLQTGQIGKVGISYSQSYHADLDVATGLLGIFRVTAYLIRSAADKGELLAMLRSVEECAEGLLIMADTPPVYLDAALPIQARVR